MSGLTSVPGDKFTDETLAKNFVSIVQGFNSIDSRLDMFDNWIRHLEGHVTELYQAAKATAEINEKVKTPSRVKPFLIGAVVGVVAYRYVTQNRNKVNAFVENTTKEARKRVEDFEASKNGSPEKQSSTRE